MVEIPQKINPDKIVEAIVEIRFEPNVPEDAVFGIIYQALSGEFTGSEPLPITQLPNQIRKQDINLQFAPHFQLNHDDFFLLIGPRVITFNVKNEYIGWATFFPKIEGILSKILTLNVLKKPKRVGLRYINFFENEDIFINSNLKTEFTGFGKSAKQSLIRNEYIHEKYMIAVQISNNATIKTIEPHVTGSVLDIDVYFNDFEIENMSSDEFSSIIDKAHNLEKETFYSILKEDYIKRLNPEY